MNEFTVKKLGEVLAFANAGLDIFKKGKQALKGLLNEDYEKLLEGLQNQATQIKTLAKDLGSEDLTLAKAEATKTKLLTMAEMYIGSEWDNPAELMEWFGFFEGAAIIHWKLVLGSSLGLNDQKLESLATESIEFHANLLNTFGELIKSYATEKVSQ